jgi:hypothetical protein
MGNNIEIMHHVLKLQYISFLPKIYKMNFRVGHVVVQLVEALHYKPECHGFDSLWCQRNFSLTQSFWPHCGPRVDSASDRTEYQAYFLGGG